MLLLLLLLMLAAVAVRVLLGAADAGAVGRRLDRLAAVHRGDAGASDVGVGFGRRRAVAQLVQARRLRPFRPLRCLHGGDALLHRQRRRLRSSDALLRRRRRRRRLAVEVLVAGRRGRRRHRRALFVRPAHSLRSTVFRFVISLRSKNVLIYKKKSNVHVIKYGNGHWTLAFKIFTSMCFMDLLVLGFDHIGFDPQRCLNRRIPL